MSTRLHQTISFKNNIGLYQHFNFFESENLPGTWKETDKHLLHFCFTNIGKQF